ncbi:MAG: glutathione S-transferase N-terminal domain-containing protein [Gammaproteobacteria bacterium]|nr:glutathione S-transferase N-terminal domain-containing protein [Gammaproteobacteria bacterium]MCY4218276.1 glutathione S-transferase N-terminal domain-containing protein [Gammaproteobacteria bacterium]
MIDLYTWSTPNGRKISIMLEETELPYEVYPIDIGMGDQHTETFLAMNPNGKIPVIVDRENGKIVFESAAILIYLANKTGGRFLPKVHSDQYWTTIQWLMFQVAHVGPMLGQVHHFTKFNPGVAPYAQNRYLQEALRLYQVFDTHLKTSEYLAGPYSIADMATWPWIARFNWQTIDISEYPNVLRWYISIAERPAVHRAWQVPPSDQQIPMP